MLPSDCEGSIDKEIMKLIRINMEQINKGNNMWFHFEIYPQCETSNNGINMVPYKPYFGEVKRFQFLLPQFRIGRLVRTRIHACED